MKARGGAVLDNDVRWGGEEETPETCHSRAEVLDRIARQHATGMETQVLEVVPGHHADLLGLRARHLTPILNVSNLSDSFDCFARLGWAKLWDWRQADGTPTFGAVRSGQCDRGVSAGDRAFVIGCERLAERGIYVVPAGHDGIGGLQQISDPPEVDAPPAYAT